MVAEGTLIASAAECSAWRWRRAGMKALAALVPTALPSAASRVDLRGAGLRVGLLRSSPGVALQHRSGLAGVAGIDERRAEAGRARRNRRSGAGTRDALVVLEVALALVLMVGAGLMLQTVARLRAIDIGFRPDHLLTLRTTLPRAKYQDPVQANRASTIACWRACARCPAWRSAAYSSTRRSVRQGNTQGFRIRGPRARGTGDPGDALLRVSSGDYLQTLGVRLKEGRMIRRTRQRSAPRRWW